MDKASPVVFLVRRNPPAPLLLPSPREAKPLFVTNATSSTPTENSTTYPVDPEERKPLGKGKGTEARKRLETAILET